jgi:hypothetical protein
MTLGYIYNTEDEAKNAVESCNLYYGIPKENCLSTTCCNYDYSLKNNYYFIEFGDTLREVLGEPTEIDIYD